MRRAARVSMADARQNIRDVVSRAEYRDEVVVITRRGKPVAFIAPMELLPDDVVIDDEDEEGGETT